MQLQDRNISTGFPQLGKNCTTKNLYIYIYIYIHIEVTPI
jgi:hypothetical protein